LVDSRVVHGRAVDGHEVDGRVVDGHEVDDSVVDGRVAQNAKSEKSPTGPSCPRNSRLSALKEL
jgi:hypothetical protein